MQQILDLLSKIIDKAGMPGAIIFGVGLLMIARDWIKAGMPRPKILNGKKKALEFEDTGVYEKPNAPIGERCFYKEVGKLNGNIKRSHDELSAKMDSWGTKLETKMATHEKNDIDRFKECDKSIAFIQGQLSER